MSNKDDSLEDQHYDKNVDEDSLRQLHLDLNAAVASKPAKDRKAFVKNGLKLKPVIEIPKHSFKDDCGSIAIIDFSLIQAAYRYFKRTGHHADSREISNDNYWKGKYFVGKEVEVVVPNGCSEESDLEKALLDLQMSEISNDISDPEVLEICNNYTNKSFTDVLCATTQESSPDLKPSVIKPKANRRINKVVKPRKLTAFGRRKKAKKAKCLKLLIGGTKKISSNSSEGCLEQISVRHDSPQPEASKESPAPAQNSPLASASPILADDQLDEPSLPEVSTKPCTVVRSNSFDEDNVLDYEYYDDNLDEPEIAGDNTDDLGIHLDKQTSSLQHTNVCSEDHSDTDSFHSDSSFHLNDNCDNKGVHSKDNSEDNIVHSKEPFQDSDSHSKTNYEEPSEPSDHHSIHSDDNIHSDNNNFSSEDKDKCEGKADYTNDNSEEQSAPSESDQSKNHSSPFDSQNLSTDSFEHDADEMLQIDDAASCYSEVGSDSERNEDFQPDPGVQRAGVMSCYDPAILQKKPLPSSDDEDSASDLEPSFKRKVNISPIKCPEVMKRICKSSSSREDPFGFIGTFKDLLLHIKYQCKTHNIAEAVRIVNQYLPLHSISEYKEIFRYLFEGIKNSVRLSPTVPEESITEAFDILKKSGACDRQLCSEIIITYYRHPNLFNFAVDLVLFCQNNDIPINSKAVQAYAANALTLKPQVSEFLKFLKYAKQVCKVEYPKQMLCIVMERVPKGPESCLFPAFEQLCELLQSLTVEEYVRKQMRKFIRMCVDYEYWEHLASFLRSWIGCAQLTDLLRAELLARPLDNGRSFWNFADALFGSGELSPECVVVFGSLGIQLMFKAYCKSISDENNKAYYMRNAFENFCVLQTYDINIWGLQECFCRVSYVTRKELAETSDRLVYPFELIFCVIDMFVSLGRHKDAYHVVEGFAKNILKLPEKLSESVKKSAWLRHLKYFMQLSRTLQLFDPLDTGLKCFHDLVTFLTDPVILDDVGSFTKIRPELNLSDVKTLFNEHLVLNLNRNLRENIFELYRLREGPCKTLLTLEDDVLRGMAVFLAKNDKFDDAIHLFEAGSSLNIYRFKKNLSKEDYPWKLTIYSHWTSQEMRLAITVFLRSLCSVLKNKDIFDPFDPWFTVEINCEESHSTPSQINCLMEQFSANESVMQRVCKILKTIDPDLKWTEHEDRLIFEPISFYTYWNKNRSDSPEVSQSFHISASRGLAFGESNAAGEASSDSSNYLVSSTTADAVTRRRVSRSSSERSLQTPELASSARLPEPFRVPSPVPARPPYLENSTYLLTGQQQKSSSTERIENHPRSPRVVQQSPGRWSLRETLQVQSPGGPSKESSPSPVCENQGPGRFRSKLVLPSPKNVSNQSPGRSSVPGLSPGRLSLNNPSPGTSRKLVEMPSPKNACKESPKRTISSMQSPKSNGQNQSSNLQQSPKQTVANNSPGKPTFANPATSNIPSDLLDDEASKSIESLPLKNRLRPVKKKKTPLKKGKKKKAPAKKAAPKAQQPLSNLVVMKNLYAPGTSQQVKPLFSSSLVNHSPELSVFSEPKSRINQNIFKPVTVTNTASTQPESERQIIKLNSGTANQNRPAKPISEQPRPTLRAKRRLNMNTDAETVKLPPYRIPTPCKQIKVLRPVTPSFNSRCKTPVTFTSTAPWLNANVKRPIPNTASNIGPGPKNFTNFTISLQGNRKRITALGAGRELSTTGGAKSVFDRRENFDITRKFVRTSVEDPIFKLPQARHYNDVPDPDYQKIFTFLKSKVLLNCTYIGYEEQEDKARSMADTFIQDYSVTRLDRKTLKLLSQYAESAIYY